MRRTAIHICTMPGRYYQPPHVPEAAPPCVSGQELAHAQESALNSGRNGLRSNMVHLFAVIGVVTVVVLTGIGSATIFHSLMSAPASYTLTADISELENPPAQSPVQGPTQVHGDCQCDHSNGAVCCCCSHCGCSSSSSSSSFSSAASPRGNQSPPTTGGNWDIDVGGIGTAGGGYCQCDGGCCCCSSCDCTGPGTKLSNVTLAGQCNGVSNCNSDLPARQRRALSESILQILELELRHRRH